ncbi:MAG: type I-B CRISPR-associated protein Cas5b, partial [Clostridium sp.]
MKVLTFTVKGDFARFRIPYTTTSALSYSLIHPIAIKGLIGAIMGIDYKDLFEYTEGMEVGIQVLNPLNKDTQSFNLVPQTGANNSPNFQSRVEFLRNVKYRIFLSSTDEKLKKIENVMKERSFQFTPYLGA